METNEHKNAGDQIRIEGFGNPYFTGSKNLSPDPDNALKLTMMNKVDGIPVPLDLNLSAGDIVALAGDYYTKAGWGNDLNVTDSDSESISNPVQQKELRAFRQAFDDLASPNVKKSDVDRIYAIENKLPSLLQEVAYAFAVKDYSNKLYNNVAHFSPWSVRAYIVGHNSALRMAQMAYLCHQIADKKISEDDPSIPQKLKVQLQQIRADRDKYQFSGKNDQEILVELGHRYHALAVSRDLFAMHFYSDHFAGGHMSRMGMMRKTLPEQFGVWGSVLVNNMHNEDNNHSVTSTNPFQPEIDAGHKMADVPFSMIREDTAAYGDGTYFEHENNENSNMLINGMDNSLGDIARLMATGEMRKSCNYGGLAFLPEIDKNKRQTQPLLIHTDDGKTYFRSDLKNIKMLSPSEYQQTVENPGAHGYEQLTYFKSFLLVLKLRVLAPFYASKVESIDAKREKEIASDEQAWEQENKKQPELSKQTVFNHEIVKQEEQSVKPVGEWRNNKPASVPAAGINRFLSQMPLGKTEEETPDTQLALR